MPKFKARIAMGNAPCYYFSVPRPIASVWLDWHPSQVDLITLWQKYSQGNTIELNWADKKHAMAAELKSRLKIV